MALTVDSLSSIGSGPWSVLRGTYLANNMSAVLYNKCIISRGMSDDFIQDAALLPSGSYRVSLRVKFNGNKDGGSTVLSHFVYGEEFYGYGNSIVATKDMLYIGTTRSSNSMPVISYSTGIQLDEGDLVDIDIYRIVNGQSARLCMKAYLGTKSIKSTISDEIDNTYWAPTISIQSASIEDNCNVEIQKLEIEDSLTYSDIAPEFDGLSISYQDGKTFHNVPASASVISDVQSGYITYTIDGSAPLSGSNLYTGAFNVFNNVSEYGTSKIVNVASYSSDNSFVASATCTYNLSLPKPFYDQNSKTVIAYNISSEETADPNFVHVGIDSFNLSLYSYSGMSYSANISYTQNYIGGLIGTSSEYAVIRNIDPYLGIMSDPVSADLKFMKFDSMGMPVLLDRIEIYDEYETSPYVAVDGTKIKWRPSYEKLYLDKEYEFKVHKPTIIRSAGLVSLSATNSAYNIYYSENDDKSFKQYSATFSSSSDIYAISKYKGLKSDISYSDNGKGYYSNNPVSIKQGSDTNIYYEKVQRYVPMVPFGYGVAIPAGSTSAVGVITHEKYGTASYSSGDYSRTTNVQGSTNIRQGKIYYGAAVSGGRIDFSINKSQYNYTLGLINGMVVPGEYKAGVEASILLNSYDSDDIKLTLKYDTLTYTGSYTSAYNVSSIMAATNADTNKQNHTIYINVIDGVVNFGIEDTQIGTDLTDSSLHVMSIETKEDSNVREYFDRVGAPWSLYMPGYGLLGDTKIATALNVSDVVGAKEIHEIGGIRHGSTIDRSYSACPINKEVVLSENTDQDDICRDYETINDIYLPYHHKEQGLTITGTLGSQRRVSRITRSYLKDEDWSVTIDTSHVGYKTRYHIEAGDGTDTNDTYLMIRGLNTDLSIYVTYSDDGMYTISCYRTLSGGNISSIPSITNRYEGGIIGISIENDSSNNNVLFVYYDNGARTVVSTEGYTSIDDDKTIELGIDEYTDIGWYGDINNGGITYVKGIRIAGTAYCPRISSDSILGGCCLNVDGTKKMIPSYQLANMPNGTYKIIYNKNTGIIRTDSILAYIGDDSILLGVANYSNGLEYYCPATQSKAICARVISSDVVGQNEKLLGFGDLVGSYEDKVLVQFDSNKELVNNSSNFRKPSYSYTGNLVPRSVSIYKENAISININKVPTNKTTTSFTYIPPPALPGGGVGSGG